MGSGRVQELASSDLFQTTRKLLYESAEKDPREFAECNTAIRFTHKCKRKDIMKVSDLCDVG